MNFQSPWRLIIDTRPASAFTNMAIDELLLQEQMENHIAPTIRFYTWKDPSVSLGYTQDIKAFNLSVCNNLGISIVRRITGGKAILHWQDFTYSIVAREGYPGFEGSVLETYKTISGWLARGLNNLGIDIEVFTESEIRNNRDACFSIRSPYELTVKGKKLFGSAQRRTNGVILQHGSLPGIDTSYLLFQVLEYPNQIKRKEDLMLYHQKAASLEDILGYQPAFQDIALAMAKGLSEVFHIAVVIDGLHPDEQLRVDALRAKYASLRWTVDGGRPYSKAVQQTTGNES